MEMRVNIKGDVDLVERIVRILHKADVEGALVEDDKSFMIRLHKEGFLIELEGSSDSYVFVVRYHDGDKFLTSIRYKVPKEMYLEFVEIAKTIEKLCDEKTMEMFRRCKVVFQ